MIVACGIVRRRIACRKARRCGMASRRITSRMACRVGMVVACGIVRRRIACRMARRRIASRHIPAHVGDFGVPAVFTVGHPDGPSSAMPRPNSACSRRRQPLFANIYSFAWPWRSLVARSAARLRRGVGRLHNYIARRLNLLLTKCYHFLTVIA